MTYSILLRTACVAGVAAAAFSFAPRLPVPPSSRSATTSTTALFSGEDDGGISDFDRERMNIVRQLQRSYYRDVVGDGKSSKATGPEGSDRSSHRPASLDPATGRVNDLPLWRVGWVETPGRRNCLNVHEMQYTHMFERILSQSSNADGEEGDDPLYFGHLYLPGGTASAKTGEERYRLKTWREELADEDRFDDYDSSSTLSDPGVSTPAIDRSAVVGCLMQIVDHRRMDDGRLMLLVQALERFVVNEIVDTRPYAVANVQMLLDEEELPWEKFDGREDVDEEFCEHLRGKAVSASFYYHDYEFGDRPKLPVSKGSQEGQYLSNDDVPWLEISKLLPFARYSSDEICLDAANRKTAGVDEAMRALLEGDGGDGASSLAGGGGGMPLERELRNGGVTWDPPAVANVVDRRSQDALTCDDLETLLWLALDDFCRATGFALPGEVARLLPPEMDYLDVKCDRGLSRNYPRMRRQRRLSYLAPALIENLEAPMKGMRQAWLNAPSTRARLLGALERYDYLNNKMMGQFE